MNTAIPRVTGIDGKRYPVFHLSQSELQFLVDTVHRLRHEQRLSIVGIQRFLEEHGVPRAHGTIQRYLNEPCEECPNRDVDLLQAACAAS